MVSIRWLEQHKPHWDRLEHLVRLSKDGLAKLNHQELQELGLLYRQTASDLSVVQEDASSAQLAAYLKQLLGRSHNLIYMGYRPKAGGIVSFYLKTYPNVFRETLPLTLVAIAIFAAGAIAGWAAAIHDPGLAYRMLGPKMMETIERRQMWTESVVAIKPVAASAITTNNLTVAFMMFASGITVIGPVWVSLFNGLLLGVIGAATWHAGMAMSLWSFAAPHGSLELPAIFIAGGSGLAIARAMHAAGAGVVLAARSKDKLEVLAREMDGRAVELDMMSPDSIRRAAEDAGDVDILVNVAGMNIRKRFDSRLEGI